jgi:hypothetical protein
LESCALWRDFGQDVEHFFDDWVEFHSVHFMFRVHWALCSNLSSKKSPRPETKIGRRFADFCLLFCAHGSRRLTRRSDYDGDPSEAFGRVSDHRLPCRCLWLRSGASELYRLLC